MNLANKDLSLSELPLFSRLSWQERSIVKARIAFREYKKGEIIYKEGTPGEAFYVIILGRVVIYTQDKNGPEQILEYLHRGKYFGIISLLTNEPHSVTARAINDCLILTITKEDFNFILGKIPSLAIDLSQSLSRRLKRKDIHHKTIFETTIISVFSSRPQAGKSIYALNLSLGLNKETHKSVIVLDVSFKDKIHTLPEKLDIKGSYPTLNISANINIFKALPDTIIKNKFGIDLLCLDYKTQDGSFLKKLIDIFSLLVNDYHYIILDLPGEMDNSIFLVLNQSDLIHLITSPEASQLEDTHGLVRKLKDEFSFQESRIKVIVNEYRQSEITNAQQVRLLGREIFATLPKIEPSGLVRLVLDSPESEYSRAMRRVCRYVGDRLVGLALGVGVAYGFCHIGVLKVIEEERIPIDVISGSSVGAIIASLWATGKNSQEIIEITKEFREPNSLWAMMDWTVPLLGFLKGNKLYSFLKKHFGDKTFYDIKLPLKIVASDIKRKELIVFEKGLLVDAIMASCSMPGVFKPFKFKNEMLFDGGVINPLPTEPLARMGVRKIIAINVTPSREDVLKQYAKLKEKIVSLAPKIEKEKIKFSIKNYLRNMFKTNILDYIFSSIEILQSEVAKKEGLLADIVLHPDLSGLYWLELHKSSEFAKRGEEEARRNLDKIWQVINE